MAGLATPPFVVAVLGAPGLGKTLMLHEVSVVLRGGGITNRVVQPGDPLIAAARAGVLLIDDAGRLEDAMLLRLIGPGRPLVLAGRPSLQLRLATLGVPVTAVELSPLLPEAVAPFLSAGPRQPGRREEVFRPDAMARLAEGSRGVPRLVHGLARTALLIAQQAHSREVEVGHVERAIMTLQPDWATMPSQGLRNPAEAAETGRSGSSAAPRTVAYLVFAAAACLILGLASGVFDPALPPPRRPAAAVPSLLPPAAPAASERALPPAPRMPAAPSQAGALLVEPHVPEPAAPAPEPPPATVAKDPPLPTQAVAHITIRFPSGDAVAADRAAALARGLRDDGYLVADPRPASQGRQAPGIRYVFAEDRSMAEEVAAMARRAAVPTLPISLGHMPPGSEGQARPGSLDILLTGTTGE